VLSLQTFSGIVKMALDKILRDWRKEVSYFDRNKAEIEKKYGKETYVVIYKQKIVDFGQDRSSLLRKYDPFNKSHLITNVNDGEKIVEILSPKIVSV
jgi:hypothetical protein